MAKRTKAAAKAAQTEDLRSNIMAAIVREVGRLDPLASGTYTKPDSFQNGQYGKYEKADSSSVKTVSLSSRMKGLKSRVKGARVRSRPGR